MTQNQPTSTPPTEPSSIWIARDVSGRMQGEVTMFITKPELCQGIWRGKFLCFVEASLLPEEIRPGECREFVAKEASDANA